MESISLSKFEKFEDNKLEFPQYIRAGWEPNSFTPGPNGGTLQDHCTDVNGTNPVTHAPDLVCGPWGIIESPLTSNPNLLRQISPTNIGIPTSITSPKINRF